MELSMGTWVGYRTPVPDFYLVLHDLRCRKRTIMPWIIHGFLFRRVNKNPIRVTKRQSHWKIFVRPKNYFRWANVGQSSQGFQGRTKQLVELLHNSENFPRTQRFYMLYDKKVCICIIWYKYKSFPFLILTELCIVNHIHLYSLNLYYT